LYFHLHRCCHVLSTPLSFYCSAAHPSLPSFPTRRSSDLEPAGRRRRAGEDEGRSGRRRWGAGRRAAAGAERRPGAGARALRGGRSEEHTSELQSHLNLVCRLLLEKKKAYKTKTSEREKPQ